MDELDNIRKHLHRLEREAGGNKAPIQFVRGVLKSVRKQLNKMEARVIVVTVERDRAVEDLAEKYPYPAWDDDSEIALRFPDYARKKLKQMEDELNEFTEPADDPAVIDSGVDGAPGQQQPEPASGERTIGDL